MRLVATLAATALVGVVFLARPPATSACSCAATTEPHPEVLVEGVAGRQIGDDDGPSESDGGEAGEPRPQPVDSTETWALTVEAVQRGPLAPGDEIEVHILRGSSAGCGVQVGSVEAHRAYRIGGAFDEEAGRLHLNLCSGALVTPFDGTATPESEPPVSTTTSSPDRSDTTVIAVVGGPDDSGGLDGRVVGGALGAATAIGAGAGAAVLALRRRSGAARPW